MKKWFLRIFMIFVLVLCSKLVMGDEDSCGPQGCPESIPPSESIKESGLEITYEDFVALKSSEKQFLLLDTRLVESYDQGHIEGALSFPWSEITQAAAQERLPKGVKIIVYCASASCSASATAAKKLQSYGFEAADYHGGVKEWVERGNELVK